MRSPTDYFLQSFWGIFMAGYFVRRLFYIIPTVILITMVGFIIMELPPGDFVTSWVIRQEVDGDTTAREAAPALRERYGLDQPLPIRFVTWISGFVRGDFGDSLTYGRPVRELIAERLLLTLLLSSFAMFITWAIAIPLGIYSATHQYSITDYGLTAFAFLGLGMPAFVLALVFLVLGWQLQGQVPTGLFSEEFVDASWSFAKFIDLVKHIWIPAAIVAVSSTGGLMRVMRGNLLDQLKMQYVQTSRAKGISERRVIWKHAVRNSLHPIVMSFGMTFPQILSGSAIVGVILNLPTTGPLLLQAFRTQDIYLGGTLLIMVALMLVIGNFIADILLAVLDPRIRFE